MVTAKGESGDKVKGFHLGPENLMVWVDAWVES